MFSSSAFSISTIIKATRVVVKSSGDDVNISRGSRTTARGRRLLKVREEKRKREFDCLRNYPSWAKYLGIQQVVFGGQSMGDWEEGMINPEDGYKSFKI
ncbi:hypothetical protein Tco_1100311 [Tanacetum coccineum]